jgi:cytochrome c
MRLQLLSAVLAAAVTSAAAAEAASTQIGNPEQGRHDFAVCGACHQVGTSAKNGVGPVLNGIVGRKAASYPGYIYSAAMKNSGITWTEAALKKYLTDPQKVVPGNKMPFPGLHDTTKVDDLIAYLSQFDAKGAKAP